MSGLEVKNRLETLPEIIGENVDLNSKALQRRFESRAEDAVD